MVYVKQFNESLLSLCTSTEKYIFNVCDLCSFLDYVTKSQKLRLCCVSDQCSVLPRGFVSDDSLQSFWMLQTLNSWEVIIGKWLKESQLTTDISASCYQIYVDNELECGWEGNKYIFYLWHDLIIPCFYWLLKFDFHDCIPHDLLNILLKIAVIQVGD